MAILGVSLGCLGCACVSALYRLNHDSSLYNWHSSKTYMSAVGGNGLSANDTLGRFMPPKADVAVNRFIRLGVSDRFVKLHQIGASTIACRAIVARSCSRTSGYTIVQRYTRKRISYWFCRLAALDLQGSQDERNAVCLRRAER